MNAEFSGECASGGTQKSLKNRYSPILSITSLIDSLIYGKLASVVDHRVMVSVVRVQWE